MSTTYTTHLRLFSILSLWSDSVLFSYTLSQLRKEHVILAQLRSGYCRLLGYYKSMIKKDAIFKVYDDLDDLQLDVKHLFDCRAHPTALLASNLWSRPMDAIRHSAYSWLGIRNEVNKH